MSQENSPDATYRGLLRELVVEAKAELASWEDMGAVEQMREDASGWVGLVERLVEQLEATDETYRHIAMKCGEDGTEPDDWRAMAFPGPMELALMAVGRLRSDYDEAISGL